MIYRYRSLYRGNDGMIYRYRPYISFQDVGLGMISFLI